VLKPGGRCAVACTVSKKPLDPAVKWPACMEVFMALDETSDVVERNAGLSSLEVHMDASGGAMNIFEVRVDDILEDHTKQVNMTQLGSGLAHPSSGDGVSRQGGDGDGESAEIMRLRQEVDTAALSCTHARKGAERRLAEAIAR
jgi:hypothetical protein